MLNRRGAIVLVFLAALFAAFMSSAKADDENFGGTNATSSSELRSSVTRGASGRILHRPQRVASPNYAARFADGIGPRPGRWCGWWMQHRTGITSAATGLNLNRAFDWRRVGSAGDGSPGNVLVGGSGRSHVSLILERLGGGCYLTISGNAGRANGGVNQMRECGGMARRI